MPEDQNKNDQPPSISSIDGIISESRAQSPEVNSQTLEKIETIVSPMLISENDSKQPVETTGANSESIADNSLGVVNNTQVSGESVPAVVQAVVTAATMTPSGEQAPLVGGNTPVKKGIFRFVKPAVLVSVGIVLTLGVASYATYSWYQTPQKVVTDSLWGILNTDAFGFVGNVTVKASDSVKVSIDLSSKGDENTNQADYRVKVTTNGETYAFSAGMISNSEGDLYLKVSDADKIIGEIKSYLGVLDDSELASTIDSFVKKVDGTWIKITSVDMKDYSEQASKSQQCLTDAMKKYQNDKVAIQEIGVLYEKNQFIAIDKELGQVDGNIGYSIKADETKTKSFTEGFLNTSIYKNLHECDSDSFTIDLSDNEDKITVNEDSNTTGSVNIWVNAWSHKLAKIEASMQDENTNLTSTFNLNYEKVKVSVPDKSMSVSDLKTNIEDLITPFMQSHSGINYDYEYDESGY